MTYILHIGPLPGPLNITLSDASPRHLTFSWTPFSNSCRVQSYAINSSNCGVCPENTNLTTARCIGFQVPAKCTFTVRTIVCENLVSTVGTALMLMLQGTIIKKFKNTAIELLSKIRDSLHYYSFAVPPPPRMINNTLFYSRNNTLSRIIITFAAVSYKTPYLYMLIECN